MASGPLSTVQLFREFQTVGAVQRKARSACPGGGFPEYNSTVFCCIGADIKIC